MKHLTSLIATFVTVHVQAQIVLKCTVLDSASKAPLAYVNAGIPNKNVGTVSNENGVFTLAIVDSLKSERIQFSSIGYTTKTIAISTLVKNGTIYLATKAIRLKEIVVKPHTIKQTILGTKTTSKSMVLTSAGKNLGWEIATLLNVKHKETHLKNIKISMVKNPYVNAKYRINIYSKNTQGNIGDNILKEPIIGVFPSVSTVIEIDLTKYNIYVDDDVYVAIEQIAMYESGKNQITFSAKLLSKVYFRESSQGKWTHLPVGFGMWVDAEY